MPRCSCAMEGDGGGGGDQQAMRQNTASLSVSLAQSYLIGPVTLGHCCHVSWTSVAFGPFTPRVSLLLLLLLLLHLFLTPRSLLLSYSLCADLPISNLAPTINCITQVLCVYPDSMCIASMDLFSTLVVPWPDASYICPSTNLFIYLGVIVSDSRFSGNNE